MAEILLNDTPGFSETADTITIAKSALAYSGYNPRSQMTLEEFVLALLTEMGEIFTQAAQDADPDRQIVVSVPTQDDVNLTGIAPNRYAQFDYTVTLRQPAPTITITPLNF
jgi:hypothetical protein